MTQTVRPVKLDYRVFDESGPIVMPKVHGESLMPELATGDTWINGVNYVIEFNEEQPAKSRRWTIDPHCVMLDTVYGIWFSDDGGDSWRNLDAFAAGLVFGCNKCWRCDCVNFETKE